MHEAANHFSGDEELLQRPGSATKSMTADEMKT